MSTAQQQRSPTQSNDIAAGTVKWFSPDKGFGFLVGEDGIDRYFGVRDIRGATLPTNGTPIHYRPARSEKGPRAKDVRLQATPERVKSSDDRVICSQCSRKMVPRIVTGPPTFAGNRWTPVPKYSLCPFCAGQHEVFEEDSAAGIVIALVVMAAILLFFLASL